MKRVLLDTNTLVSTILNHQGVPAQAYKKAVEPPYQALICEQTLEELRRVFNRKFPDKIPMLERFIATMIPVVEVIPVPPDVHADEDEIRDADDRPILRAAIKAGAIMVYFQKSTRCLKVFRKEVIVREGHSRKNYFF